MSYLAYRLKRFMLRLECGFHRTDIYLAKLRGDHLFAADAECRADDCIRELALLDINRRYSA